MLLRWTIPWTISLWLLSTWIKEVTRCQTIKSRVVQWTDTGLGPGKPGCWSYPMHCATWHTLFGFWKSLAVHGHCLNPAKGWAVLIPLRIMRRDAAQGERWSKGQRAQLGRGRASVLSTGLSGPSASSGSCVSVVKTVTQAGCRVHDPPRSQPAHLPLD